ncbi:MAG: feruloyl-CoA synthase, partial [Ramlibacter sp.]
DDAPEVGLMFDGRISENFKLASGTWVSVGPLRTRLIEALAPLLLDAVVGGHDRSAVSVLAWLRRDAAAEFCGLPANTPMAQLVGHPKVREHLAVRLREHNRAAGGSSRQVAALLLLDVPPLPDEIVDKGYINQRAALRNRAAELKTLYAATAPEVIFPAP